MHWSMQVAKNLVEQNPHLDDFVCASGISPSGDVHIGNFREVVTTYFVVKALRSLGKNVRFIFSWDDFDRFRKVPQGLDPSYSQYIGLPYTQVPDPFGCCESYAHHYEGAFEGALKAFGIVVDFIYQSQEYQSGRYLNDIHHALVNRQAIYDIIMAYKTQEATPQDRAAFYPIALYCEACGKDTTRVTAYDQGVRVLYYSCACGHQGQVGQTMSQHVKLIWKVDWPMRWRAEGVIFEPGGRDHSSQTGSFVVASDIMTQIFKGQPPHYVPYDFIGIKGSQGKMSSSTGHTLTPADLLKVYSPEVILNLFSKYQPETAFNIGMDDDVIKHHSEFERVYAKFRQGDLPPGLIDQVESALLPTTPQVLAPFGLTANVLPLVAFNRESCKSVINDQLIGVDEAHYHQVCDRVEAWINNWAPDRAVRINQGLNRAYYVEIDPSVQADIKAIVNLLHVQSSGYEWLEAFYQVTRTPDAKATKKRQALVFKAFYHLLISQDTGPRLPLLVDIIGSEKSYNLVRQCYR